MNSYKNYIDVLRNILKKFLVTPMNSMTLSNIY